MQIKLAHSSKTKKKNSLAYDFFHGLGSLHAGLNLATNYFDHAVYITFSTPINHLACQVRTENEY